LVVGGGVVGMTSAFRFARAGWSVTLFDPSPGAGATSAAAGMIAPGGEITPGEHDNFERQRLALGAWRALASELADVTGETLEVHETGTMLVGFDASDRRLVDQFAAVATSFGVEPRPLTRDDHPSFFEGVSARVHEGLYLAGDGWIDPDRAMALLTKANELLGVGFLRQRVLTATSTDRGVDVTTTEGSFHGDVGLLATGARALPDGVAHEVANVVRPVRGMTVRVRGIDRSTLPTLRAFVRGRAFYMVSRPGGYDVLGASSDELGELVVEVGDLQRLLRDALDVFPSLEDAEFLETRQGLRPASKDHAPFLEVSGRWVWSSGHYRHGVTLAPLTSADTLQLLEEIA
jgi:glycine oxidase